MAEPLYVVLVVRAGDFAYVRRKVVGAVAVRIPVSEVSVGSRRERVAALGVKGPVRVALVPAVRLAAVCDAVFPY